MAATVESDDPKFDHLRKALKVDAGDHRGVHKLGVTSGTIQDRRDRLGHGRTCEMTSAHPKPLPLKPAGWCVYLLRCRDGSLYTGITNDLARRLKTHAAGKASRYTRSRLPVQLVYTEPQRSQSSARKREAAIKKLSRACKDLLVGSGQGRSKAGSIQLLGASKSAGTR